MQKAKIGRALGPGGPGFDAFDDIVNAVGRAIDVPVDRETADGRFYVLMIGVTGTGQKHCYRLFHLSGKNTKIVYGSYWNNHDPLDNGDAVTLNWSTASMSFANLSVSSLSHSFGCHEY
jgi:hypothetical protein